MARLKRVVKDSLTTAPTISLTSPKWSGVFLCGLLILAFTGCAGLLDLRGPASLGLSLSDGQETAALAFSGPWGFAVENHARIRSEAVTGSCGVTTRTLTVEFESDAKEAGSMWGNLGSAALGFAAGMVAP